MFERCLASVAIAIGIAGALAAQVGPGATSEADTSRLIGEVMAHGQQMKYVSLLSDEIGHRLTGSAGARRAEEAMEAEMRKLGLANVHREPFTLPASWERGPATAVLVSHDARALHVAAYLWTPSTAGAVEAEIVEVGNGAREDLRAAGERLRGAVALAVLPTETVEELIATFYRIPRLVRELEEAGAVAVLIASDKQHAMLFTAPVAWKATAAAIPALSLAREDVELLRRLLAGGRKLRVRLDVRNRLGPAFEATNVVGEIRGRERPEEIVVVGAHLDSVDLGPGALDNAAGVAAAMEAARAMKALGIEPRRTIRFVLFMGEEEGMIGSMAYVRRHRDELDRTVAALIMDIGAGRPLGWFSMGRSDLDPEIRELMEPLQALGVSVIEHLAFAATDNAPFMAEGVPNLLLIQDEASYLPVHHTVADTPDKVEPRDLATAVAVLAATAYRIAERDDRFGRRLTADEVRGMARETKVDDQWRDTGIWP